jgi:DNA-binding response OmpR family regulator
MAKILVVEDEEGLRTGIVDNLEAEGYSTLASADGLSAWEIFQQERPELIILDVMLPKQDGFSLCEQIRQTGSTVKILFLSAKATVEEKIKGLSLGGDDYMAKPFDLRELLSRVAVLMRRGWGQSIGLIHGFRLNLETGELKDAKDRIYILPQYEVALFRILWQNIDKNVEYETLIEFIWGDRVRPSSLALKGLILALAKRLKIMPQKISDYFIESRGVGYRLSSLIQSVE